MENEEMTPSYWPSVTQAAIIIGVLMAAMGIGSQYMTISNEPAGAQFSLGQLVGILICLVAAIGGIISTRQHAKENNITFTIGTGALIGFLTGVVGVVISGVINLIWTKLLDPGLNQAVYDWQIANLEAQNLSDAQLEMALSFMPDPTSMSTFLIATGVSLLVIGIVNLLSGMIGAKIFASED
tara:strand:+ start:9599 stop:10147 length:549 start_codon:yes stop_codon:yes gene_type:complete